MEKDEIIIRNAIVHILDSSIGLPVLSDKPLEPGPELNDFLREHIYRIAVSDDTKSCSFNKDESTLFRCIENFEEDSLIPISQEISQQLYTIMNQNIDIPAADMFFVTYQVESQIHLAMLKMNYKESYVHYTDSSQDGHFNDIIKQKATLPSQSSRLTEAALINLSDYTLKIVEKKYDINGAKVNYFSSIFLMCHTKLSSKAKLNIVTKAVEQINKKYYDENFDKHMEVKSILHNELEENGSINIEQVGGKLFQNNEMKQEFVEKLEKYNIVSEEVKPQNKQTTRKLEKQFLTTDTGIEINIPMEQYNNKENVEFMTNPDGTISVWIKNINHITSK